MGLLAILLLRLLAPLAIMRLPLVGVGLCVLFDAYDYQIIGQSFIGFHNYQYVDKFLDTYFLLFMAYASRSWFDKMAFKLGLGLIAYRILGVLLFFVTGQEYLLVFFPNIFIDFYLFYLIFSRLSPEKPLLESNKILVLIMTSITAPKLLSEYSLHVSRVSPIPLPAVIETFYSLPEAAQLLLYFTPASMVLVWVVLRHRGRPNLLWFQHQKD